VPRLTASGRRTGATPDQALSSIARDAIEVLSGPDAELLKECGRPECTQVYLDRSRGARREWCAMETCGNKMKAAAYRARKKAEALV
jgi:predicted RNA-binding Zn ribbon-like protein